MEEEELKSRLIGNIKYADAWYRSYRAKEGEQLGAGDFMIISSGVRQRLIPVNENDILNENEEGK
jgi:hypothetical protein